MTEWYAVPDESREPWCFLIVECSGDESPNRITGWQLGYGNPRKMVRTDSWADVATTKESEVIKPLYQELGSKRYNGVTIITLNQDTIDFFRTRLLCTPEIERASLRGFKHIDLGGVLDQYLIAPDRPRNPIEMRLAQMMEGGMLERPEEVIANNALTPSDMWQMRKWIEFLVPSKALRGTFL